MLPLFASPDLDVRNILITLHKGKFTDAKWFELGQQLITYAALKTIEANHGGGGHLMTDMVSLWLRSDLKAFWETLADGVELVGKYGEKTAETVRKEAGIGKIATLNSKYVEIQHYSVAYVFRSHYHV